MQPEYFWNQWRKNERYLYLSILGFFTVAALWMLVIHFSGIHAYLDWNVLAEAEKTTIITNVFNIGPFNLTQSAENLIFFQKFDGTSPRIGSLPYYLFLGSIGLALTLIISIVTFFSRFWYFIGIALFTFLLASIKLELLLLLGSSEKIGLIIGICLYLPLSYYFNQFKTSATLPQRIGSFFLITVSFSIFLFATSTINHPFYYLATSINIPAIVISIVFVLTVGHEIIAGFLYLLFGRGAASTKNGFLHFIIISLVYLGNILLAYLHEIRLIDWDILYLNPIILLIISGILGIWGFRHRENQYGFAVKFAPYGGLLYLLFGLICFVTIAYLYTIGNDPGVEIITDFIYYAHLAYGVIFILYILANFIGLIKSKLAIYKVIYKPTAMPYFTFRFAGLIIVIALVLRANWQVPVYQSIASSLNSVADYHYYNSEKPLAERYYLEASDYALYNHKANYAIASINDQKSNVERAIVRYKEAIKKWPSPQAYINLSNLYQAENRFFDALFVMKEAEKEYSDKPEILNTLGLLYGQTNIVDSAIYYLDKGAKLLPQAVSSNILATLAAQNLDIIVDSVLQEYNVQSDPVSLNNTIVLANKNRNFKTFDYLPRDSTLSTIDLALLSNGSLNALYTDDTLNTNVLDAISNYRVNWSLKEGLDYIRCLHLYKNGRVNDAFRTLNWIATTREKISAKYFDDIGLWALEQGAPDVAVQYFQWALDRNYEDAELHLAIAMSENLNDNAIKHWQNISEKGSVHLKTISEKMIEILSGTPNDSWDNYDKYLFCRYALNYDDSASFRNIVDSIEDLNYKARSILSMAQKLWDRDLIESAIDTYNLIQGIELNDKKLFERIQFFELKMLAHKEDIRGIANKINQDIQFNEHRFAEKAFYTALIAEASNDTTLAKENYGYIAKRNPFFEEAVIAAARFENVRDPFKAYDYLLSAIEVNPNSIKLLKAYIYQCARVQQNTSGEYALQNLKALISTKEFNEVEKEYNRLVKLRTQQDLS